MKFLLTLFLISTSIFSSAQINKDSLLVFLLDELKDDTIRQDAFRQYVEESYQEGIFKNVVHFEKEEEVMKMQMLQNLRDSISNLNTQHAILQSEYKEKEHQALNRNLGFFFLGILSLIIFTFYSKKQKIKNSKEHEKLLQQIDSLKQKLTAHSLATPISDKKSLSLNKEKIEKAINSKLGESSWIILNLIFMNPSISNKEIAKEVSLSLEGVSSSLRRMYQAFEISNSSNKKITLIMKATRLSFEN